MKKELKYSFSKNRNEKQNSKISTSDLNLILSTVYDDEFVSLINKLSSSIKIFSKSNNKNFNKMKNLFQIEYNPSNEVLFTFSNIEKDFSNFYLTAKAIFKKMKIYRNDKLSSLSNLKFKNINNRLNSSSKSIRVSRVETVGNKHNNIINNNDNSINLNNNFSMIINTENNLIDNNRTLEKLKMENLLLKKKMIF